MHHSSLEIGLCCDQICQEIAVCGFHCIYSFTGDDFRYVGGTQCGLHVVSVHIETKRKIVPDSGDNTIIFDPWF